MRFSIPRPLLAVLLLAACSGKTSTGAQNGTTNDTASSAAFDVNDISYLFPSDSSGNRIPDLSLTDQFADGTEILPDSIFQAVETFAATQKIKIQGGVETRANWKVMGFRYDPCAPSLDVQRPDSPLRAISPQGCLAEIRLITQPVVNGQDLDFTLHLTFVVGLAAPTSSDPLVKGLLGLKAASAAMGAPTSGVPLSVHPGLAKSDASGPLPSAVKGLLLQAGSSTRLAAVAFMGLENFGFEPWVFFAGSVQDGAWTPITIPVFQAAGMTTQSMKLGFTSTPHVAPTPPQPTSTAGLFPALPLGVPQGADNEVVYDVEQPVTSHFFNVDCVSCHTSTSRALFLNVPSSSSRRFRSPTGVTGYASRDVLQKVEGAAWNVRNFGYFKGKPTVSNRTVNETAVLVDFLNQTVLKQPNPGPDCSAVDDAVVSCFLGGGSNCLDSCTQPAAPVAVAPPTPSASGASGGTTPAPGSSSTYGCKPASTEWSAVGPNDGPNVQTLKSISIPAYAKNVQVAITIPYAQSGHLFHVIWSPGLCDYDGTLNTLNYDTSRSPFPGADDFGDSLLTSHLQAGTYTLSFNNNSAHDHVIDLRVNVAFAWAMAPDGT